jgi:DNA-binding beta-propeller fold protein YncE
MSVKERSEMKLNHLKLLFLFTTILFFTTVTTPFAGVDMDLQHKLTMDNPPLDVVATPDGKYIFVLTNKGNISVFDQNGVLQNKFHVGDQIDQIKMDPQGNRLFITSRSGKTIQIISLDFFVEINTADAPFKGPRNAPVVVAVFSDFQ